jgi:hypothetical protein
MRSDPSDTGGLFVGRRPGTQPVHYRSAPVLGNPRQRRRDAVLGHFVLALMVLINLTFWGPVEAGWLWIVSHIPLLVEHIFFATVAAFLGILLTLIGGLVISLPAPCSASSKATGGTPKRGTPMLLFCSSDCQSKTPRRLARSAARTLGGRSALQ